MFLKFLLFLYFWWGKLINTSRCEKVKVNFKEDSGKNKQKMGKKFTAFGVDPWKCLGRENPTAQALLQNPGICLGARTLSGSHLAFLSTRTFLSGTQNLLSKLLKLHNLGDCSA